MFPARLPQWNTACLVAACALYAAEPDGAVVSVMRNSAHIYDVHIMRRVAVDPEFDLVVAMGAAKDVAAGDGDVGFWSPNAALGILLQRRSPPEIVYTIALSKGHAYCEARVERATAKDVVLSCTPEKGNLPEPNRKFVYDIRSKALVKQIDYQPFALRRIFVTGDSAVLVGSDTRQLVAVKYDAGEQTPFHILKGAEAGEWTERIERSAGAGWYLSPRPFTPVRFGPGDRFALIQRDVTRNNGSDKRLVVVDRAGGRTKYYWLPQSSYDEFARARPEQVRNGYGRQDTTIDETIGPWQIVDGTLWFAKSFYDGEGVKGVGGFGYFDTDEPKYHIYSPQEMADWSASAMLVEPQTVYLALAANGEYGTVGGGLLRFDRASEKVQRIEFRELVGEIVRIKDRLLLATDFGAAVVENHRPRRFFVDESTDGRLQVVESVFGK